MNPETKTTPEPTPPTAAAESIAASPPINPIASAPGAEALSFLETLQGERPATKSPTAKPAGKVPANPTDPVGDDAKPKPEKKKSVPKPAPVQSAEPNYEKITEAAARGVANAMKQAEPAAKPAEPEIELSAEEQETFKAYAQMERDHPDKYKDLSQQYVSKLKAAEKWEADWMTEHPGQELDANNPDYLDYVEQNAVKCNEVDFQRALTRMDTSKIVSESTAKSENELAELKRELKARDAIPTIVAERASRAREYFSALGDDFKDVLKSDGSINREEISKLVEADPLKEVALRAAENVEMFTDELYRLSNGLKTFESASPGHAFIAEFVAENENALARMSPAEQQLFVAGLPAALKADKEGKQYATASEYEKIPANQRAKYYRLQHQDMAHLFALQEAQTIQKTIATEEKRIATLAEKRGYRKVETAKPTNNGFSRTASPPSPAPVIPRSPTGGIEPRMALPGANGTVNGKNAAASFTSQWLG